MTTTINTIKTPTTALIATLDRALSLCRPHGSSTTVEFTQWLWENLPAHLTDAAGFDAAGNLHIDARQTDAHRTLFIAHVDTVHRHGGPNKIVKTDKQWSAGTKGQCLGADDGAGVALLMHLMHSEVPGYYIFSQGEEVGGIGAQYLADHQFDLLQQFDRAIAFDRKGIDSVITHQAHGRCCSDAFATALSDALNNASGDEGFFAPDATGIYTDTAEFVEHIPECTNISVGYSGAHGDKEALNMEFFLMLADAVLRVEWDMLPTERDPSVVSADDGFAPWYGHGALNTIPVGWSVDDKHDKHDTYASAPRAGMTYTYEDEVLDALESAKRGLYSELIDMIAQTVYPEDPSIPKKQIVRSLLTADVLENAIDQVYDGIPVYEILEDLFAGAMSH